MMLRRIAAPAWASTIEVLRASDFADADYAALQTARADTDPGAGRFHWVATDSSST